MCIIHRSSSSSSPLTSLYIDAPSLFQTIHPKNTNSFQSQKTLSRMRLRLDGLKGTLRRPKRRRSFGRDEEDLIIKLHALLGHRWSLIAGRLPGRTENEIKDYWHSYLKRKLVSMGIDPNNHRPNQTFFLARHRRNYEDNHDIGCDDDATSSLVEGEELDNNNNNNLDLKLQPAVSSSSSSSSSSCGAAQSDESVRVGPAASEEGGNNVDDNNETSTLLLFR